MYLPLLSSSYAARDPGIQVSPMGVNWSMLSFLTFKHTFRNVTVLFDPKLQFVMSSQNGTHACSNDKIN